MVIDAGGTSWHVMNGGDWYNQLDRIAQREFVKAFEALPLMIEATIPDGRRIGIAHASFPPVRTEDGDYVCDWNDAEKWCAKTDWRMDENEILWNRYQISRAKRAASTGKKGQPFAEEFNIRNIDHVFFGHTPLKEPLALGNCVWLDTGAFATKNLTIVEL